MKTLFFETAIDTELFAATLASMIEAPANIYLEGQLGAGKTTFVKGFLAGCGYEGLVKSPTYTLVETYDVRTGVILHADLYRIKDLEELETMGFRDYFNAQTIGLIEWASHAKAWLPTPLFLCTLKMQDNFAGRVLEIQAGLPLTKSLRDWFKEL